VVVVQESSNDGAGGHGHVLNEGWGQTASRTVASCRGKQSGGCTRNGRRGKALECAGKNQEVNVAGHLEEGKRGGGAGKADKKHGTA
jgi:hypothetical protein